MVGMEQSELEERLIEYMRVKHSEETLTFGDLFTNTTFRAYLKKKARGVRTDKYFVCRQGKYYSAKMVEAEEAEDPNLL